MLIIVYINLVKLKSLTLQEARCAFILGWGKYALLEYTEASDNPLEVN